jgi:hypothetical protein
MRPREYTCEEADAAAHGETTFYRFGQPVSAKLTRKELELYELAKQRRYIQVGRVHANERVAAAYFDWCEGARFPVIKLRFRGHYATLSVDLISCVPPTGSYGPDRLSEGASREMTLLFAHHGVTPAMAAAGCSYILRKKVPYGTAQELAPRLVAILSQFPGTPRPRSSLVPAFPPA